MTVINPSSISGITSITMPSGDGNVLTIHTNDGVERFRIDSSGNIKVGSACTISPDGDVFFTGVTTATTFTGAHSGSGANLTSLPAAQLTGTLPAISGANLTGIAATDNVRTGILDVAGIATFRNDVNVGTAVTITESGIEATGVGITCANINGTKIGGRRNLISNGDFRIAQRGTSSTSTGFSTVDRWNFAYGGTDEAPTAAQHTLSSSDDPYSEGFRYSFHITNGNQSSGAGATDYIAILTSLEAQDLVNSGWDYTNPLSDITISFWAKSSVARTFCVQLYTADGTPQAYNHHYALSANTWKKVIHTFPGYANVQFDNDANKGMEIQWNMFSGTTYTEGSTVDQWVTYNGNTSTPDENTDWYTTNDATFEITGVQLEVGSQATAFEHRSYGDELALCQRYYQVIADSTGDVVGTGFGRSGGYCYVARPLLVEMRTRPTVDDQTTGSTRFRGNYSTDSNTGTGLTLDTTISNKYCVQLSCGGFSSVNDGDGFLLRKQGSSNIVGLDAEL